MCLEHSFVILLDFNWGVNGGVKRVGTEKVAFMGSFCFFNVVLPVNGV